MSQPPASPSHSTDSANKVHLLEIRLFGTPIVCYRGKWLKISRLISRGLLYYLAVQGRPVGRTSLAVLFWPELPIDQARARLRDYLSKIKKTLPDPSLLITDTQTVSLDFTRIYVDYLAFQELFESTNRKAWAFPTSTPLPKVIYQTLLQLANFDPDPDFLPEMDEINSSEVSSWLGDISRQLKNNFRSIIQHLYFYEHQQGNLNQAIHWLYRALSFDPADEDVNRLLIKTLQDTGQREQAQKHFEQYASEMNYELSPEMEALKISLFNGVQGISPAETHSWPLHPTFNTPYTGQDEILAQANRIYARGGGLLLLGEAGAGKTRLVKEIHQRVAPHPNLLLVTCKHHEIETPFHPWIELFRIHTPREVWMQLPPEKASLLNRAFPELNSWRKNLKLESETITGQIPGDLFDAFYFLLEKIENNLPTMLYLDNIHWADQSSHDFIQHVLSHSLFRRANRLIIMTAQREELKPEVANALKSHSNHVLEQIELPRLDESQVSEIVRHLAPNPSKEFIQQIRHASGGNPLFLLELMREVLDTPNPKFDSLPDLPLPKTIQEVFQRHLQSLSPDAVEVLGCAAVIGDEFDARIVEKVVAYTADRFVDALEELVAANLLNSTEGGEFSTYTFLHEKFRESLVTEIPTPRLKLLHHRIADTLANSVNGDTEMLAVILAQHYHAAGEYSQAFDYCVQSALYAYKLTSIKEAFTFFERAKALIPKVVAISDKQLYTLYSKWSDLMINQDNPIEAERISQEFLSVGRQRNSDLLIGTALDRLGAACFSANQFEQGLDYSGQAIPYLERAGNIYELLLTKSHQGEYLYMLGRVKESKAVFDAALKQIPASKDKNFIALESSILMETGTVDVFMGHPVKGLHSLEQALEHRENIIAPAFVTNIYTIMGLAHYLRGEFKSGYEICAKAIELGEHLGYKRMCGYAYAYRALNAHYLGYLGEAWDFAEKARKIGDVYGHPEISALAFRTLGVTHQRLFDYGNAIEYFSKGLEVAGDHFVSLELMTHLGYSLTRIGQVKEGLEYINQAKKISSQLELGCISIFAEIFALIAESQLGIDNDLMMERLEVALIEAKIRSMNRAVALLNIPFITSNQNPHFILRQLNENLQDATRLSDPVLQMLLLSRIIILKRKQAMPDKSESEQLITILEALAPQAAGKPFEKAWENYSRTIQAA